jgi:hypothetical protein
VAVSRGRGDTVLCQELCVESRHPRTEGEKSKLGGISTKV